MVFVWWPWLSVALVFALPECGEAGRADGTCDVDGTPGCRAPWVLQHGKLEVKIAPSTGPDGDD